MATDSLGALASANATTTTRQPAKGNKDSLRDVNVNDFLNLLITELQNQDPLNPTDNDKILQQISSIRNIQSTTQLNDTLQSVLVGQSLGSASNMIDRLVHGLTEDGKDVYGKVEGVSVVDGTPKVIVDEHALDLKNIREILPAR